MATAVLKKTLPPDGKRWTVKDLTGKIFGRLTVVGQYPVRHKNGNARWVVECSCGTVKIVRSCHLIEKHTVSCGCWNDEKQKLKEYDRATFVSHMIDRYQRHAVRRGIVWTLTPEQFDELIQRNCFYCGIEPLQKNRTQRGNIGHFAYNGVDRLANHLGYFIENCVPCCGVCNIAKQDMSAHDFMKWIARLWEHNRHVD